MKKYHLKFSTKSFNYKEIIMTNTTGEIQCRFQPGDVLYLDVEQYDFFQFYSPKFDLYFIYNNEQMKTFGDNFMNGREYKKWLRKQKLSHLQSL